MVHNFGLWITATVLGTVKDGRLRLPPLRDASGILDRPPLPLKGVGTGSVPSH